jgi:2-amino-4-hydroxy-6-hydroxymethyldihydropteridine diphosphokinase
MRMATIYLALGSNLDEPTRYITDSIELLHSTIHNIIRAPLYTSKAIGYTNQPDFINTAIRGDTDLEPVELLNFIKTVEKKIGRIERFRWGPREIDIDIIFYDNIILQIDTLSIPHSQFSKRDFVLQPLIDISPEIIDPKSKQSLSNILHKLDPKLRSQLNRVDV